jgi:1D-myo-inositol-triphosphate 3-kinase
MSKVIMYYNRRGMAVQIAGHKDAFRKMTPDTVCKEANPIEKRALEILMTDPHMRQVVPLYHGQLTVEGKDYLQLEDLLKPFKDPIVMDIKMGLRTFLESEVSNQKLRSDLLKKLLKLDKTAATAEELEQDGITKLRYMQYREQQSSSSTLGFRIEGQKLSGREVNNDFKSVRLRSDVLKHLREYIRARPEMKTLMGQRLRTIRTACEESAFFRTHECIGSSLLFAYDLDGPFNIWCIDFGKTIECDHQLSHRAEWVNGNHEDGYLKGVDELISLFDDL